MHVERQDESLSAEAAKRRVVGLLALVAGSLESGGRGVLAERSGETARCPAPSGSVELAFQPRDGDKANPGLISQILL